ncbi:hypothetical protein [Amycolatopsis sp. cmx-4-61]|uniref:hypothetical protein n=1 Tax=Amycolatopsis sp. cmx-4-61 TaxID=2790937 RepID=UPI00397B3D22
MGYQLQGAIAIETALRELAGTAEDACIVPLTQHLCLLPMTDALFDAVTVAGAAKLDGFRKAPAGFGHASAACSTSGPAAYVEADYFVGTGTQSAQVWGGGQIVLGPLLPFMSRGGLGGGGLAAAGSGCGLSEGPVPRR